MRLLTYEYRDETRPGASHDGWIVDLERAYRRLLQSDGVPVPERRARALVPPNLREILEGEGDSLKAVRESIRFIASKLRFESDELVTAGIIIRADEVRLWPPIPDPSKIVCLGGTYPIGSDSSVPTSPPAIFAKYSSSLVGDGWPIVLPPMSNEVDYEAELALVIGRKTRSVAEESAMDHVVGVTILHDVSARDCSSKTSQWLAGKTFDTFAPMGPWIVTLDEFDKTQGFPIKLEINGERLQDANTSDMHYSLGELVAYVSSVVTLEPGDIVSTGTPDGVGFLRNPKRFLGNGDVVAITIDGIGTLTNPVTARGIE